MNLPKLSKPDLVLYGSIALFLILVAGALRLLRLADIDHEDARRQLRLLEATRDDLLLLKRYEEAGDRLAAVPSEAFSSSSARRLLPGGVPPPDESRERASEVQDGFRGRQLDWTWKSLGKRHAFAVLAALQSPSNLCWRVAGMKMDALPDGERVSFHLVLETAVPSDGVGDGLVR